MEKDKLNKKKVLSLKSLINMNKSFNINGIKTNIIIIIT